MSIPRAIFSEAFLSFIGIGIRPPMTSWGQLANIGAKVLRVLPYQLFIPGIFISLTMLSLNIFGDGLRDALDPKLRK
jgi:oligopeptide transport system permease protein